MLQSVQNANSGLTTKLNIVVPEFIGAMSAAYYPVNQDGSVPDQLRRHIMAQVVWSWLTDFPALKAFKTDERKKAAADAERVYEKICNRTYGAIEAPYGTDYGTGNWNSENRLILRTHPTPSPQEQFQETSGAGNTPFYANPNAPTDDVPQGPQVIIPPGTQIVTYFNSLIVGNVVTLTNQDGTPTVPINQNAPALAYPSSGQGDSFTWNVNNKAWNP